MRPTKKGPATAQHRADGHLRARPAGLRDDGRGRGQHRRLREPAPLGRTRLWHECAPILALALGLVAGCSGASIDRAGMAEGRRGAAYERAPTAESARQVSSLGELRDGISTARPGGQIVLKGGTYVGDLSLSRDFPPRESLVIVRKGPSAQP
jgi:hypothetical protein